MLFNLIKLTVGFMLCGFCLGQAQSLKVGLILPLTGENAAQGQAYLRVLETFKLRQEALQPYLSQAIEISLRDDRSSPVNAERLTAELIAEGVHVLVCCLTQRASQSVMALTLAAQVPSFALSPLSETSAWGYALKPSDETVIRAIFLALAARSQHKLALMTVDAQEASLEAIMRRLSVPGGIEVIEISSYPFDVDVLTPEALWVATRLPDAVLIWDSLYRSKLAYEGLRERGYEQNIFLSPELFKEAWLEDFRGAFSLLSPLEASLLEGGFSYPKARDYQDWYLKASLGSGFSTEGAELFDALSAISMAFETLLSYGIRFDDVTVLKTAMIDSIAQLGVVEGLTGSFDFSYFATNYLAESLVISRAGAIP